jgi:hypothetical protein
VYFRKNICMDRGRASIAAKADQANGNPTKSRRDFADFRLWRDQGLSARAAAVAAAAGCRSLDEIRDLGRSFFLRQENCGNRTLQELSDLVGGWQNLPHERHAWVRRAPDGVLIDELRRRGIAVGSGKAS